MKRKILALLSLGIIAASLAACGSGSEAQEAMPNNNAVGTEESVGAAKTTTEEATETTTEKATETTTQEATETTTMSIAELNQAINAQPAYVREVQFKDRSSLRDEKSSIEECFCDYLDPIVCNNSKTAIKNVQIAYVGWDANNLPVMIDGYYKQKKGYGDNLEGYIVTKTLNAVNIPSGGTYQYNLPEYDELIFASHEDSPFLISYLSENKLVKSRGIVVKYEDFDGNTWENPYYYMWVDAYSEKPFTE